MASETPISEKQEKMKPTPTAEPVLAPEENGKPRLVDRAAFLALAGELKEDVVTLSDRAGKEIPVLVRELTGEARAALITLQIEAYQKGSVDLKTYEREMLLGGVADPESPEGARLPLLKPADAEVLMKLGASNIGHLVKRIEELSAMGQQALSRAEGNSGNILSVVSTSGSPN